VNHSVGGGLLIHSALFVLTLFHLFKQLATLSFAPNHVICSLESTKGAPKIDPEWCTLSTFFAADKGEADAYFNIPSSSI
jgi:hypothetical protein